ncbi:MAG: AbrB/MazE/SpoVT family DNA-binding domain-containing protein, partial [Polyangiaceae bacterium]
AWVSGSENRLVEQLFITSHAPFFEDITENFYRVSHDGKGTLIERRPYAEARPLDMANAPLHFVKKVLGGLAVVLPPRVAEDLGVKEGDRIFFYKPGPAGSPWQVLNKDRFLDRNSAITRDDAADTSNARKARRVSTKKKS